MTTVKRLTVDPTQLSAVLEELTQALLDGQWIQLQAPKGDASESPLASACPQGAGVIMASGGSSGGRSWCLQPADHLDQSATATGRWLTALGLQPEQMLVLNPLPVHHMSGLMPWWRAQQWGAGHGWLSPALMKQPRALLEWCRQQQGWGDALEVGLDERGALFRSFSSDALGARGVPYTAILDAEGAVVSWFVGDTDWAGEAALAYFNGLLDDAE